MTNRRGFLGALGALLGAAILDPEQLLWKPGAKLISVPKTIRLPDLKQFGIDLYYRQSDLPRIAKPVSSFRTAASRWHGRRPSGLTAPIAENRAAALRERLVAEYARFPESGRVAQFVLPDIPSAGTPKAGESLSHGEIITERISLGEDLPLVLHTKRYERLENQSQEMWRWHETYDCRVRV
jgi:hypothetical protein